MPAICIFYGIIIRMYNEKGGKHNKPHIHAEYQGEEIVIALDGEILEGEMPRNKMKLLKRGWKYTKRIWKLTGNFFQRVRSSLKSHRCSKNKPTQKLCGRTVHIRS